MSAGALRPWLALSAASGLDDGTLCRLVQTFGSADAVLKSSRAALQEMGGLGPRQIEALRRVSGREAHAEVERSLRLIERGAARVLTYLDQDYPPRLRTVPDPPLVLYVSGSLDEQDQAAIAVVGSRRPSPVGRLVTEQLSRELAAAGFTIVSGLARGIDGAAHEGAIAAGGRTLAVLGCGIDRTYPSEHETLRKNIELRGAVLSDLPVGAHPLAHHFPRRNRIISGLSVGVVVTEAAARSGSLITARLALEQGREVFAVPGSIRAEQSRGTNGLIKQGAKLVESAGDVIEELLPQLEGALKERVMSRAQPEAGTTAELKGDETIVYRLLSAEPTPIDDLIYKSGLAPGTVTSLLLSMELKGLVRRLPGSCTVRV